MLFDDYFYPGNPERRQEVNVLRGQVRADFLMFYNSWNDCAALLNPILKVNHPDLQLLTLVCDINSDNVRDCIEKFNAAITDAKPKFAKLLSDIGLTAGVPGINPGGIDSDPDAIHKINNFITGAFDSTVAAFATWYVYNSIQLFSAILSYAGVAVSEIASVLAGVLGGMVVGAIGFVITDVIASAIAGAVERKQLQEAIGALQEFRDKVSDPLLAAAGKLAGITQSIKDGAYKLSDEIMIIRTGNVYQVIAIPPVPVGKIHIASNAFPNVYLRLDGAGLTKPLDSGGGIVNCQFGAGPYETFNLITNEDETVSFCSSAFPHAFLRLDGAGLTVPTGPGGGIANAQYFAGPYERFLLKDNGDGTRSIASTVFPNVYLRLDGTGVNRSTDAGLGIVNGQIGVGPWEKFKIENVSDSVAATDEELLRA